ncbi:hypothetical protein HK102_009800 [Quaeritorhiza haematococci]|nr:hypothetical protein HK102_009800 [Quaeritorhiza haematococci]
MSGHKKAGSVGVIGKIMLGFRGKGKSNASNSEHYWNDEDLYDEHGFIKPPPTRTAVLQAQAQQQQPMKPAKQTDSKTRDQTTSAVDSAYSSNDEFSDDDAGSAVSATAWSTSSLSRNGKKQPTFGSHAPRSRRNRKFSDSASITSNTSTTSSTASHAAPTGLTGPTPPVPEPSLADEILKKMDMATLEAKIRELEEKVKSAPQGSSSKTSAVEDLHRIKSLVRGEDFDEMLEMGFQRKRTHIKELRKQGKMDSQQFTIKMSLTPQFVA